MVHRVLGCMRPLGVDDEPAPQWEVEQWLALRLGVDQPRELPPGSGGANKRCRNRALVESGYQLRYPDYRSGYSEVIGRFTGP